MKYQVDHIYLVKDKKEFLWECKTEVIEITVLEISSKGRIKMLFPSGAKIWQLPTEYEIVEDLGNTK